MQCTHGQSPIPCGCAIPASFKSVSLSRRNFLNAGLAASLSPAILSGCGASSASVAVATPAQNNWLIKNATIYTADGSNTIIEGADMVVNNGLIQAVGKTGTLAAGTNAQTIDATGHILFPGFINNHYHDISAFRLDNYWTANIDDRTTEQDAIFSNGGDLVALNALAENYDLSKGLTPEEAYTIALYNYVGHLRNGTTTIGDVGGVSEWNSMAQAALDMGIRCGPSIWGQDAVLNASSGLVETTAAHTDALVRDFDDMLSKWARHSSGRIRARPSMLIPTSSSDAFISQLGGLSRRYDTPFVMHAGALRNEQDVSQQFYGKRSIQRLADNGVLNQRLTTVHTAYITDAERLQLLAAKVNVDHAPAKYGFGGEPTVSETKQLTRFLAEGGNLAVSTDGDAVPLAHMISAMQAASIMHNESSANNIAVLPSKVLEMATRNPAKAMLWDSEIGSIEVGKKADFSLVKADDWRYAAVRRQLSAFLANGGVGDVKHVFVDGKQLVRDGEMTMLDEKQLKRSYYLAMQSYTKRLLGVEYPLPPQN